MSTLRRDFETPLRAKAKTLRIAFLCSLGKKKRESGARDLTSVEALELLDRAIASRKAFTFHIVLDRRTMTTWHAFGTEMVEIRVFDEAAKRYRFAQTLNRFAREEMSLLFAGKLTLAVLERYAWYYGASSFEPNLGYWLDRDLALGLLPHEDPLTDAHRARIDAHHRREKARRASLER